MLFIKKITEQGGFGLQSHTSCVLLLTRLRPLTRTSCALILAPARRGLRFESPKMLSREILYIRLELLQRPDNVTEQGGFEPPVRRRTTVFKTAALNHSATAP